MLWLAFAPSALAASPLAAGYPTRAISLAVPFTADDQASPLADLIQSALETASGRQLTLLRLPGRGGGYALRAIMGQPPDGHFLALFSLPSLLTQALPANSLYSLNNITPVAVFAHVPTALWVKEDSSLSDLKDLVSLARSLEVSGPDAPRLPASEARPEDAPLPASGSGSYSDAHIASLLLARAAGIRISYLPFLSTAKAAEAVSKGDAAIFLGPALPSPPLPGLRPLAVASENRLPLLPHTPTFRELGLEVISGQDFGLAMPAGADPGVISLIAAFLARLPENTGSALQNLGYTPVLLPPSELSAILARKKEELNVFLQDYDLFSDR
jgi:tripartite-type tricarboxylate transporter receptor subunit TctC